MNKKREKEIRLLAEEHSVESLLDHVNNLLALQRKEDAEKARKHKVYDEQVNNVVEDIACSIEESNK